MKKKINVLCFILILALLILSGCKHGTQGGGGENIPITPPIKDVIEVTSLDNEVKIKDLEVIRYDFTSIFKITVNGKSIKVEESYINKNNLKAEPGNYNVVCMYKGSSASINVVVLPTIYEVNLAVETVKVDISQLRNYDFKSYFSCLVDGKTIEITNDMIKTNLIEKVGTYNYTVTNGNVSKTLTIELVEVFNVEIMVTYNEVIIEESKLKDFDFTKLFTIYTNGKYVPVTSQMIDKSSLDNYLINNTYPVTLNYKVGQDTYSKTCQVKIVAKSEYTVKTKDLVIYPNSEIIDLKTLFEVQMDNQIVPITDDMISGIIDYTKIGENIITLNLDGKKYVSKVTIKLGVIINYTTSDTITILKGTNQVTYPFINDFNVLINGIQFNNISNKYLDTTGVDFNTNGVYEATLTLPYNDNKIGLQGFEFKYISKTIKYVVVNNNYKIDINNETLIIDKDNASFNPFINLEVVINGKQQTLTDNPEYVDAITCLAKVISSPIKFDYVGIQEVKILVYANGIDLDPVTITYNVIVESDITIEANDQTIYTNDELDPKNLFTIREGNKIIPVTMDMITGRIDPTTPGAYTLTIEYLGLTSTAKLVVLDANIKGVYKTSLRTFKPKFSNSSESFANTKLGDLVINDDGTMTLQGNKLTLVKGISEKEFVVKYRSNEFTLHYGNGVIILDPINDYKMSFNNSSRPIVYFNTNAWRINSQVVVNYGTKYVLEDEYVTYSIDIFNIQNVNDNTTYSVGLKTNLISRQNSDTEYEVTWGEVKFKDKFNNMPGSINNFTLNNTNYRFQMKTDKIGRISLEEVEPQYKNKVFTGIINGNSAELRTDNIEKFTLVSNGVKLFEMGPYELGQLKNGGCDYDNNIVFIYDPFEYKFSYKFKLDPLNNTFELLERDNYFGFYKNDTIELFLDGYGSGEVNYNTKSYYVTQFNYEIYGNTIKVFYKDILPSFEYGDSSTFTIDSFLNILTIKSFAKNSFIGQKLIINEINDGAIVDIKSFQIGQGADKVAKKEFFDNIDIYNKNGKLTDEQKAKVINTKKIRFSEPGFYEFSIDAMVDGKKITNYYGIEILEAIYEDSPLVDSFVTAVNDKSSSLAIDKYGRCKLVCNHIIYNGIVNANENNEFVINAQNEKGLIITGTGVLLASGLVKLTVIGDANFTDYYTTGSFIESGNNNYIIRIFILQNKKYYLVFDGKSATGKEAVIELINGKSITEINSILKVTQDDNIKYVKILSWQDKNAGLIFSDNFRGEYKDKESKNTISLDGFGNILVNNTKGTYKVNNKELITVTVNEKINIYKLDPTNHTYSLYDLKLDESLVVNKSFIGKYNFFCDSIPYQAVTTFQFLENGKVKIISVSKEHDSGENQCSKDKYNPSFASATGKSGTYTVSENKILVKVNEILFTFEIDDLININKITCIATNLDKNAHGYFDVNTIFLNN